MEDLGNGWYDFTYTGTANNIKVEIVDSASTNQSLKTTFATIDCTSTSYFIEPNGTTDNSDAFAGTTQNVDVTSDAPADFLQSSSSSSAVSSSSSAVSSSRSAVSSSSSAVSSSSSAVSSSSSAVSSSSKSTASSSSSPAAVSSESSVANPKTGNSIPVAAGSVVVLAAVGILGAVLAKKKSI